MTRRVDFLSQRWEIVAEKNSLTDMKREREREDRWDIERLIRRFMKKRRESCGLSLYVGMCFCVCAGLVCMCECVFVRGGDRRLRKKAIFSSIATATLSASPFLVCYMWGANNGTHTSAISHKHTHACTHIQTCTHNIQYMWLEYLCIHWNPSKMYYEWGY